MTKTPTLIVPLIDALARLRPGSKKTRLRELLSTGRVHVNGAVVKIGRLPIAPDDDVQIIEPAGPAGPGLPMEVVYEDDQLLVVDKPSGLLTSTVPTEKRPTALALVREYMAVKQPRAKVGLIHRLDRDASGLLVFSLTADAYGSLKKQFFDHSAERVYAAIVRGVLEPAVGTIRSRLVEFVDGTVHSTKSNSRGDLAVTHYQTTSVRDGRSLLRIKLETGRKHQIRAHCAERGHPIMGDPLYAGAEAPRLMLAAIELHLDHPTTGLRQKFKIGLPTALARLMRD
ncbi:MAG: RluA family pseudouridine synthase [Burkholderiales bacterium]|nr:RluA family pseudouridine synthase [Phycisphaerae bacterium]